ncbi:hypothetical protein BH11MYX3_BH11MYX3_11640 [soil metagenome]
MRRALGAAALVLAIGTWVAGCGQGEGDRCQVSADCSGSLVCNQATQTCAKTSGGDIDADVPDLPPADAAVDALDAPIDAPVDAAIDAI